MKQCVLERNIVSAQRWNPRKADEMKRFIELLPPERRELLWLDEREKPIRLYYIPWYDDRWTEVPSGAVVMNSAPHSVQVLHYREYLDKYRNITDKYAYVLLVEEKDQIPYIKGVYSTDERARNEFQKMLDSYWDENEDYKTEAGLDYNGCLLSLSYDDRGTQFYVDQVPVDK